VEKRTIEAIALIIINIVLLILALNLLLNFIIWTDLTVNLAEYTRQPATTTKEIYNTSLVLKPGERKTVSIVLRNATRMNELSNCSIDIATWPPESRKHIKAEIKDLRKTGNDIKLTLEVKADEECSTCKAVISVKSPDSTEEYAYIEAYVEEKGSASEVAGEEARRLKVPYKLQQTPIPLFNVSGAVHTSYLRTGVYRTYVYSENLWLPDKEEAVVPYSSSLYVVNTIPVPCPDYVIDKIIITFLKPSAIMPTPKYTRTLRILKGDIEKIDYCPNLIMFQVTGRVEKYALETLHFRYSKEFLESLSVIKDERYLQLPKELEDLRELALKITRSAKTPYGKAKAIEQFLKNNYEYDINYTIPDGENPVRYFLLKGKKGVCIHFNTAFVILARLAGLPARLVAGYLINSYEGNQTVYSDQAHAWAEVLFEKVGWIRFDATTGGEGYCCHCRNGRVTKITTKNSKDVGGDGAEDETAERFFELIVDRDRLNMTRGSTEEVEVHARCVGYSPQIRLSVTYDENSFRVDVNPLVISSDMKSRITITCSRQATPGRYRITIEGVDREGRRATATVIVTVIGYFNISFQEIVRVVRGGKVEALGAITPKGSYPYSVTLTIKGLPNGIWYIIRPSIGAPPFSFNVTFQAAEYIHVGDYEAKLVGTGGGGERCTVAFILRVQGRSRIIVSEVSPVKAMKGAWVIVKGSLRSELGEPLSNRTVIIYLRESKESGEPVKIGEDSTNNDGVFVVNCTIPTNINVGEYAVIAVFPGDDHYLGNVSDPSIIVMDRPVIHLLKPPPLVTLVDMKYWITGRICGSDGKPLPDMPVTVHINNRPLHLRTDEKGFFAINTSFPLGTNLINISTPRTGYYESSHSTLKTYAVLANLSSKNWVRGEEAVIYGYIKGLSLLNLDKIIISLENTTAKLFRIPLEPTNEGFEYRYLIGRNVSIGRYMLSYNLPLKGVNHTIATKPITIIAKAIITEELPSETYRGERLVAVFKLVDQHFKDTPLQGINVMIRLLDDAGGLILSRRLMTNKTGLIRLEYTIPENYNYSSLSIELTVDDPLCQPLTKTYSIKVEERLRGWTTLIYALTGLTAASAIATYMLHRRRTTGKPAAEKRREKEEKGEEAEYVYSEATSLRKTVKRIKIRLEFPQIRKPFPPVWGLKDPLLITAAACEDGAPLSQNLEFYIDGLKTGEGRSLTHIFKEKGTHEVKAVLKAYGKKYEKTRIIRIVDYREEIMRLYNSRFLKWAEKLGVETANKTPEEIMLSIHGKTEKMTKLVEKATLIFEEAKYSLHLIERRHYEEFYLALHSLGIAEG